MSKIDIDLSLIKAALIKSLRVGLYFKQEDTIVEYHFTKDPRSKDDSINSDLTVVCVMCSSTNGDALKMTGTIMGVEKFEDIVNKVGNGSYDLYEAKLFPLDWYPCFENDPKSRIAKVTKIIPTLAPVAEQIKAKDKIMAAQKLAKIEEDRRHYEEGVRRNMEILRARSEARFNKGIISSKDLSYDINRIKPGSLGPNGKF